jgi:uridylate kinase
MGGQRFGISADMLRHYAEKIKELQQLGAEVAVVIGGGNIFRGIQSEAAGIESVTGDYMGMLATVINSLALQSALETIGVQTRVMTALKMESVAEPYIRRRAIRHLEKGRVDQRRRAAERYACGWNLQRRPGKRYYCCQIRSPDIHPGYQPGP